jgi:hypothetical protein
MTDMGEIESYLEGFASTETTLTSELRLTSLGTLGGGGGY